MKNPIIISNTKNFIQDYKTLSKLHDNIYKYLEKDNYKYWLAIPHVFINKMKTQSWRSIIIGAQNLDLNNLGNPETGINTASQIKDTGADFVIVGHSEVRNRGENDQMINDKIIYALNNKLKVVLCIGEKNRKQMDVYDEFPFITEVKNQISCALKNINKDFLKNIIIAYEPIWAIGSNTPATTKQILEMNIIIRRTLAEEYGVENAKSVQIIYGGSVNNDNAKDFIQQSGCDGLLIGRSSTNAKEFANIINSVNKK